MNEDESLGCSVCGLKNEPFLQLAMEESKNFSDRNIFIVLVPNKAMLQKAQDPPKKRDKSSVNEVSAGI